MAIKKPNTRHLYDMRSVLYDQGWAKSAPDVELYYMFRGVKKKGDLRYDITVIPSKMLGKEFTRTKGNRNWKKFPELYTVLKGRAIFLLQKLKKAPDTIEDIAAVETKEGGWVVIPPLYAVITINPSTKELKIGNWVSEKNKNVYKELEKMKGAGYFYTRKGWIRNKNYKKVPKLRFEKPLKKIPNNLDFLKG